MIAAIFSITLYSIQGLVGLSNMTGYGIGDAYDACFGNDKSQIVIQDSNAEPLRGIGINQSGVQMPFSDDELYRVWVSRLKGAKMSPLLNPYTFRSKERRTSLIKSLYTIVRANKITEDYEILIKENPLKAQQQRKEYMEKVKAIIAELKVYSSKTALSLAGTPQEEVFMDNLKVFASYYKEDLGRLQLISKNS